MLSLQATGGSSIGLFANAPSCAREGETRCACVGHASPQRHTYDNAQRSGGDYGHYAVTPRPGNHLVSSYWRYLMRTVMALLLTLPLLACESESLMERSSESLDDATDETTDTIEDTREEVEEDIERATD